MRATLCSLSLAAIAFLPAACFAQTPAATPGDAATSGPSASPGTRSRAYIYPVEVKLVHSLDPASLKPGDHVLTKLSHVWTDSECTLPAGTALSGDVTGVHEWTRQDKQTRITLQFRYTCQNDTRFLRLITLLAPEYPDLLGIHGNPVAMQAMRSSFNGEGDPFRASGKEQGSAHYDLSGHQNPQLPLFIDPEPTADNRPTVVKRGMVWHLPGVGLNVNDENLPTTSIYSSRRAFKLPAETVLVMQPELPSNALTTAAHETEPRVTAPRRPQLATLQPEVTACPARTCTEFTSNALAQSRPDKEISLRPYGHLRGQTGEISGLEYSTAVAFLGSDELLVCVGKPGLVQRTGAERPEDHPHLVQAVLYNRSTGRVERTAEWAIPNRDRYLWPLADGRVLVHQGDRLVWYGPGLTPEHTMPLRDPLAFVHTTGDGQHLLVGTVRELHSSAEHNELYKNDNRAPEEEVHGTVYDGALQPVSEFHESSRSMPPLLWNTGRVSLRHRSKEVWYFRETSWTGEQRNFGTLTSSCVPETTALSGDRLLVIGCETHSLNAWARILRPDGSLVLRTAVHTSDLYPVAPAISARSVVLVSPRLNPNSNREGTLHAADITGEAVRVVRTTDGHVEFATDVHQPTTSAQPAAVDAAGTALAILEGDSVRLYTLPVAAAAATPEHSGN